MNKVELIEKIINSHNNLESALAQIHEDKITSVILHGRWSVKDMVGHLGFWENKLVTLYGLLSSGQHPDPLGDIDTLNQQAVEKSRSHSFQSILIDEHKAYNQILVIINSASDAELFDSNYFSWMAGHSFSEFIADNTYLHYDEHIVELTAWLKRVA